MVSLTELLNQTGFVDLNFKMVLMWGIAFGLFYLAVFKKFEPLFDATKTFFFCEVFQPSNEFVNFYAITAFLNQSSLDLPVFGPNITMTGKIVLLLNEVDNFSFVNKIFPPLYAESFIPVYLFAIHLHTIFQGRCCFFTIGWF